MSRNKYFKQQLFSRSVFLKLIVSMGVLLCVSQAQAYGYPEIIGTQDDKRLEEVSGLAPSFSQPGYFWAVNDGGHGPTLMLLNEQGEYVDEIELHSLGNHDWEDIETFRYAGQNYIAIADIGDNFTRRKVYYVHLVPEPKVSVSGAIGLLHSDSIKTIAFQYEDGPRDSEALGIDLDNKRILVLSKRDSPPRMYSLPLIMNPKRFVYRAQHLVSVETLGRMSVSGGYLAQTFYAGLPTAMTVLQSFEASNNTAMTRLAVLSYGSVWLFDLFNQTPAHVQEVFRIQLPAMPQAEAMASDVKGNLIVMSEIVGSPVVRIPKLL